MVTDAKIKNFMASKEVEGKEYLNLKSDTLSLSLSLNVDDIETPIAFSREHSIQQTGKLTVGKNGAYKKNRIANSSQVTTDESENRRAKG